jgi:hypothetical protein
VWPVDMIGLYGLEARHEFFLINKYEIDDMLDYIRAFQYQPNMSRIFRQDPSVIVVNRHLRSCPYHCRGPRLSEVQEWKT